jgi:hypothetical protein
MGIVELGALGEFVGSIAVLATLIYLSFQVREARAESRASLLRARNDAARSLFLSEASNHELVTALVKGERALGTERAMDAALVKHAGLTREEAKMVSSSFMANFFHRQTAYLSRLTDAERQTLDSQIETVLSGGLARLWFENMPRETFDASFVAHVVEILSNSKSGAWSQAETI